MTRSSLASDTARLRRMLAVYLVADPAQSLTGDLVADVREGIRGGVTCVQLRAKDLSDADAWALASSLVAECRASDIPFIMNDRLDVAMAVGADGIHVGLSDLPIHVIRELTGDRMLIGWSPETDAEVREAAAMGIDYLGIGPVFPTGSKADAGDAIGLDALGQRARAGRLPAVAIGGITIDNAGAVISTGVDGVAVISAILRAPSPVDAARGLSRAVTTALAHRGVSS